MLFTTVHMNMPSLHSEKLLIFPLTFKRHSLHNIFVIFDDCISEGRRWRCASNVGCTATCSHWNKMTILGMMVLYIKCFDLYQGHVPSAWTCSTIVPTPKLCTYKFRPTSLTSWFSKVLEHIVLAQLKHCLQDTPPSLYGFLPPQSKHHCLMEFYIRLSLTNVVASLISKVHLMLPTGKLYLNS